MNKTFNFGEGKLALSPKWMKASIWVLFIMLAHTQMGLAREYDWTGSNKDDVLASSSKLLDEIDGKDEHDFFLYNVGAKKFVFQGGYWGTKPILDANKATRFNFSSAKKVFWVWAKGWLITKPELQEVTVYVLTSNVGSKTGRWLGQKTDQDNELDNGFWMDCSDGSWIEPNYKQYKNVCWNFQHDVDEAKYGKYTYTIRSLYSTNDHMYEDHSTEHQYLYCNPETGEVTMKDFGAYYTNKTQGPNIDEYAMWRLVTVKEIKEKLKALKSADIDDPFNCTFFLKDPYLCRYSTENASWNLRCGSDIGPNVMKKKDGSASCLKLGLSKLYSSQIDASKNDSRYGTKDVNGNEQLKGEDKENYARLYAKYFCGEVRGIPGSNNSEDAAIYQKVTIPMTGWYRVSCQGFVSKTDNTSYLYAKNNTHPSQFRYVRLNNISDFERLENPQGVQRNQEPTTMDEAGYMFYDEQYPNQVYIYMNENDELELGIRFRGTNEWTAFDDFGLAYCGKDNVALALDENMTEMHHITNANSSYNDFEGCLFDLHRTFVPHKWNTFVLPVSLNWRQCQELFGSGTKVAELTGYNNDVMTFNRVEHSKTEDSKIVIEANKPYIIKPTVQQENKHDSWDAEDYTAESLQYASSTDGEVISVNVPLPFVQTLLSTGQKAIKDHMSETAFDNSSKMMEVPGTTKNGLTFHGTLTKTYEGTTAKLDLVGKYIVYDGKIYYVNQAYGLDGMRGYFSFDTATTGAKAMRFSVDGVEDSSDQITGIESILGNTPFVQAGSKQGNRVYNLSGQVVSTEGSLEGLPKGMYIIKGKKVLVK